MVDVQTDTSDAHILSDSLLLGEYHVYILACTLVY
jgi:hypothetical protein